MVDNGQLSPQEYSMRILQMLQDYSGEYILIDTMIVLVKMLTRHPVEHAVLYASGQDYKFGALEFDSAAQAQKFLDQVSEEVAYASFIAGEFTVYKYPYLSRVLREWVFLERNPKPVINSKNILDSSSSH